MQKNIHVGGDLMPSPLNIAGGALDVLNHIGKFWSLIVSPASLRLPYSIISPMTWKGEKSWLDSTLMNTFVPSKVYVTVENW